MPSPWLPPKEDTAPYDEFAELHAVASELGLDGRVPLVARRNARLRSGQCISSLAWGSDQPRLVLLHGGGQNAHTWDSVILALADIPAIAVDLPGHGRSDRRSDHAYGPHEAADSIAGVLDHLAPHPLHVVGMSLGGATAIRLAATRPALVRTLTVVDVTPGVAETVRTMDRRDRGTVALLDEDEAFASLEEMVDAAAAVSPRRSRTSVARGVRHNAVRRSDGRWTWRHDLVGPHGAQARARARSFADLWDDVARVACPLLLVRGAESRFVSDADVERLVARRPQARVEVVAGAGHSVQSDTPLRLAALIRGVVAGPAQ